MCLTPTLGVPGLFGVDVPVSGAFLTSKKVKVPLNLNSFNKRRPVLIEAGLSGSAVEDYIPDFPVKKEKKIGYCQKGAFERYSCTSGHVINRMLSCNKEYCTVCGEKDGLLHKQRIHRGINKMNYLFNEVGEKTFSSWVFTIPEQYREFFRNKINLDKLRHALIEVFTGRRCHGVWRGGLGYRYGVSVYHYCGDDGAKYNPHLNLLLFKKNDGKWTKTKLNLVRNVLRRIIDRVVAPPESVLKKMEKKYKCYSFKRNYGFTYGQCLHRWKYMTRPTFRVFSNHINEVFSGYRNIRWLGNYKNKTEQNFIEKVENMVCPVPACNSPLHKSFLGNVKYLDFKHDDHYHLAGGVYVWNKKLTKKGIEIDAEYTRRIFFNYQKRKTKKELIFYVAVEREKKHLESLLLKVRTPDVLKKIRGCFLSLLRKENEGKYFGYDIKKEVGTEFCLS